MREFLSIGAENSMRSVALELHRCRDLIWYDSDRAQHAQRAQNAKNCRNKPALTLTIDRVFVKPLKGAQHHPWTEIYPKIGLFRASPNSPIGDEV